MPTERPRTMLLPSIPKDDVVQRLAETIDEHEASGPPKTPLQPQDSTTSRNKLAIPTAKALQHSLCVMDKNISKIFEGVAYSTNQGSGRSVLCRRKHSTSEPSGSTFVLKCYRAVRPESTRSISKIMHPNIVTLNQAFSSGTGLYFIYDEMQVSLEQIMSLDVDPWSINANRKSHQIAAIMQQILRAVDHLHSVYRICHGDISQANILLTSPGNVRLANVHQGLLQASSDFSADREAVLDIFLSCMIPNKGAPTPSMLGEKEADFYSCLKCKSFVDVLKHTWLGVAEAGELAKLIVYTMRVSYCPADIWGDGDLASLSMQEP